MPLNDEELGLARDYLNDPSVTADIALSRVIKAAGDAVRQMTAAQEEADDLQQEVETLKLSRSDTVDPERAKDKDELALSRLDNAVLKGDVPPFVAKRLKDKLAGGEGLALSRSPKGSAMLSVDDVLAIFDGTKAAGLVTGEESGAQVLSRAVPGAPDGEAAKSAEDAGRAQGEAWKNERLKQMGHSV